ncbi:hypothetical protein [Flexithrix dorotheae]|uniref:hypothetical protein n=1 Tax=Flexithrix dorotheae TaxID=70993 RepID=UPI0003A8EC7D|nr:hypothetical protein [Flexithrix dorotheae]
MVQEFSEASLVPKTSSKGDSRSLQDFEGFIRATRLLCAEGGAKQLFLISQRFLAGMGYF